MIRLAYCSQSPCGTQKQTYLLEELARDAQHHTAEVLRLATSEQSSERRVAANVTRCTNTVGDDAGLESNLLILSMMTSKSGQRGYSLVVKISSHEPTRRFWQEEHKARKECAEHDLEGDWEAPCEIWRA